LAAQLRRWRRRIVVVIIVVSPIPAGGWNLLLSDIWLVSGRRILGHRGCTGGDDSQPYSGANRLKIIEHSVFSPSAE
jgi:hypothetical protein